MAGRFPFPRYPNGWFQVAYSDELPAWMKARNPA